MSTEKAGRNGGSRQWWEKLSEVGDVDCGGKSWQEKWGK